MVYIYCLAPKYMHIYSSFLVFNSPLRKINHNAITINLISIECDTTDQYCLVWF